LETHCEESAVDVVEFLFIEPVVLCVVYFETAVGWDAISIQEYIQKGDGRGIEDRLDWLDGTQVCP